MQHVFAKNNITMGGLEERLRSDHVENTSLLVFGKACASHYSATCVASPAG